MSDTSKAGILALTGTFLALTTITVGLRFIARRKAKLRYLADDWLMLVALTAFVGTTVCVFWLVDIKALGYSSFQFTSEEIDKRYKKSTILQVTSNVTTMLCLACTKTSALFFYRRIFCTMSPNMRVFNTLSIAMIVLVACWLLTFELLNGLQCHGHFNTWNPVQYAKYCTISWSFLYGFTISDFLLDVLVIVLPIPWILQLHTTLARKLSVLGIFMLGCVAVAASCVRMVDFISIFALVVSKYDHIDSEHILTRFIFFFVLEAGCSIVAISLPSLWPLFQASSVESIMKVARSVTSLASHGSDRSTRTNSNGQSRAGSIGAIRLDELPKRKAGDADVPVVPKQPKLEILRSDSIQISSKSRSGSLEGGRGVEENWRS